MALTAKERELVKEAADLITREAEAGERVILRGFGTFQQKTSKARKGRNPATGEAIDIPERTALHFKASK